MQNIEQLTAAAIPKSSNSHPFLLVEIIMNIKQMELAAKLTAAYANSALGIDKFVLPESQSIIL